MKYNDKEIEKIEKDLTTVKWVVSVVAAAWCGTIAENIMDNMAIDVAISRGVCVAIFVVVILTLYFTFIRTKKKS